jgi:predicted acylesterase/phospholipase RssA
MISGDWDSTIRRLVVLLLVCVMVTACVGRPQESKQFRDIVPMEGVQLDDNEFTPAGMHGYTDPDGSFNILALSGGGAYGAYGVGVLSGWTQSGSRPEFDIVTGVSTGALMSVFAFLGPNYDPLLKSLYTNITQGDIYTSKGIAGFFSDSVYDNTPLKKQIEQVITPQVLAAIAREHAKGRRLYVATTNLDAGELVVWNMGEIASGGRTNPLQHFHKVLRASAAVPGFFQPVYIKPQRGVQLRQAHVDGGVTAPVLIADFLFRVKQGTKNIYVIVNDSLAGKDPVKPVEPNLASIAQKSIATLTRELMIQTVYRGYARAQNSKTNFFLTSVPDRLGLGAASLQFSKKLMNDLFNAGQQTALSQTPWRRQPPQIRSFDVVAR